MLTAKVPWNLKDVLAVYILRLALGAFLVRIIYPYLFTASSVVVEMTDRILVLLIIWYVLVKHRETWQHFGLSLQGVGKNFLLGLICGLILLAVSLFSERIYTTLLMIGPSEHPLVAQTKMATTLSELAIPLLLAGLVAPFTEEILYRMFTFLPLKQRYGLFIGTILSAAVFALFHFNVYWLAELLVVGSGLALLYNWTGSLISCMVAHSVINTSKIMLLFFNFPV